MKKCLLFVAAVAVVLGLAGVAQAFTTWDGGGDGTTWDSGNNWFPDGVPSGGDEVRIDNGAQITSSGTHANAMVRVGYGTVSGLVKVTQTAGTAAFSSWITMGPTATYELAGGNLSMGTLYAGFDGGDLTGYHGTFIVSDGALTVSTMHMASQRVGEFRVVGGDGVINIANILQADQAAGYFALQPNGNALSATTLSGSAQLTGIELSVEFSANPTPGNVFTVIDKTSGGGYTGTFKDLAEGAHLSVPRVGGGTDWDLQISYAGGDGNNVTLEVIAPVPEPAGLGLIAVAVLALRKRRA